VVGGELLLRAKNGLSRFNARLLQKLETYCNTGYRSAHAYLALRLLDYPRIRNYVGSWQEWGNRDGLPIWNPA
jgi:3-mercaptopyruvate sulfurtransferase SseA